MADDSNNQAILTDAEIASICEPLKQSAAQCNFLVSLGLLVKTKPNGKPLVARSEFERVLGAGRFQGLPRPRVGPNLGWMKGKK
jgi:hypothetical protein